MLKPVSMSDSLSKKYTNGEITVVWKPGTCIHSEKCWHGLPGVFNPKGRPWINVEGATTDEIIAQVDKCPSAALTWYRNGEEPAASAPSDTEGAKVDIIPNGPIRIHGNVKLTHYDGKVEHRDTITALCRCGESKNKPYCDGTHKKVGFCD